MYLNSLTDEKKKEILALYLKGLRKVGILNDVNWKEIKTFECSNEAKKEVKWHSCRNSVERHIFTQEAEVEDR